MKALDFSKDILFIDFFIRPYQFYGRGTVRTELPSDAFFYTGPSKAIGYKNNPTTKLLGFEHGKPYLSNNISGETITKIFNDNTNIACSVSGDYVDGDNKWWRYDDFLKSNKTGMNGNKGQFPYHNFKNIAPYGFNILDVDADGTIETNFPREEVVLKIQKGQTLCFLCRKDEVKYGEYYSPNLNLVLFVKNYGFHNKIDFRSQIDIDRMDASSICLEKFDIRDFRKSRLNFQLG